ncbi:cryptochrome/photolyase family protein [Parvibaculum sp.]|uniref:cryptochrome/photolyase family protein n=1 Tax=Parvibaculum sp. TaxID=2024848 RepID=UPI0039195929
MGTLRLILGDQLTRDISALDELDKARDVVLFAEVHEECSYVRHHKQKIVFILSAMRHFARELRREGIKVDHIHLDDPENTGSLTSELARALKRHKLSRAVVTQPETAVEESTPHHVPSHAGRMGPPPARGHHERGRRDLFAHAQGRVVRRIRLPLP